MGGVVITKKNSTLMVVEKVFLRFLRLWKLQKRFIEWRCHKQPQPLYVHDVLQNNRGNGWGLCINGGYLVEFGYYEDSKLKTDLTNFVQWYYEGKLRKSGRTDEKCYQCIRQKKPKK